MNGKVKDNQAKNRYELEIDGQIVFADYRRDGGNIQILHVETPPSLRGKGAAAELMKGIMEIARVENLKVIPVCPYAVTWMQRNKV